MFSAAARWGFRGVLSKSIVGTIRPHLQNHDHQAKQGRSAARENRNLQPKTVRRLRAATGRERVSNIPKGEEDWLSRKSGAQDPLDNRCCRFPTRLHTLAQTALPTLRRE